MTTTAYLSSNDKREFAASGCTNNIVEQDQMCVKVKN